MPAPSAFANDVSEDNAMHATATALDADSAVVLDLKSQTYYELNETGYVLWAYLQEHDQATASELAEALCTHANADAAGDSVLTPATARTHTNTFLQSMRAAQLIVPAS